MRGILQEPPDEPSFLLVVLLFAATILVVLFVAYFTLRWAGSDLAPGSAHNGNPTSRLVLPSTARPALSRPAGA